MTATLATRQIKDGAGNLFLQRVLDVSGSGAGPFLPATALTDPDGTATIDLAALFNSLATILGGELNVGLAAGEAVIGKVGLQIAGSDISAANAVPVRASGPDYQASGVTAVSGTASAAGTSAGLVQKAGRTAYLWLSGGTSASGLFEYSNDAGITWFAVAVEGSPLGTFSYAAASGNQVIPIPPLEQAASQVRARFTAVSGTLSYTLSQ